MLLVKISRHICCIIFGDCSSAFTLTDNARSEILAHGARETVFTAADVFLPLFLFRPYMLYRPFGQYVTYGLAFYWRRPYGR